MKEQHLSEAPQEQPSKAPQRKTYSTPELARVGDVKTLTKGDGAGGIDAADIASAGG